MDAGYRVAHAKCEDTMGRTESSSITYIMKTPAT